MIELVIYLFLVIKNFFSYRLIRFSIVNSLIFSLVVSTSISLVNHLTWSDYLFHQNTTYIKGAIVLPSYGLLYLISDILSSLITIIIVRIQQSKHLVPIVFSEALRLVIIYGVFVEITSSIWTDQFNTKLMNTNYTCFKSQLTQDLATYYLSHQKYPKEINQFTDLRSNPINNSALIISPFTSTPGAVYIYDEQNNKIVDSMSDLLGIRMYIHNPEVYLNKLDKLPASYCPQ